MEIKEPLRALAYNTTATLPLRPGKDWWRINFSRVEWRVKGVYRQPGNLSSRVKTDSGSGLHYEHDRAHQPDTVRALALLWLACQTRRVPSGVRLTRAGVRAGMRELDLVADGRR